MKIIRQGITMINAKAGEIVTVQIEISKEELNNLLKSQELKNEIE